MNQSKFISEVYAIAWASNPDLNESSTFQEVLQELGSLKDKALRWEIIVNSFKPDPQLFPINKRPSLRDTQARRQGEL